MNLFYKVRYYFVFAYDFGGGVLVCLTFLILFIEKEYGIAKKIYFWAGKEKEE